MKMKRLVAAMLALLLMVSILPIGAMADTVGNNPAGNTVPEIGSDETMHQNRGTVTTNNGTLDDNRGTVNTNDGTVKCNLGLVETNHKNVNVNSHSVTTNEGKVITNGPKGTVTTNEKDVTYNKGKVDTNAGTGTVDKNWGNITTNNGTVNTNKTIKENGVEFKGVIETNNGTVKTNGEGGTVETNAKDGKIETNNGTVGEKDENGNAVANTGNYGTVETNNGKVLINQASGIVETNKNGGTIDTNYGTVGKRTNGTTGDVVPGDYGNYGTITTNYGYITQNKNLVVTNAKNEETTSPGYIYVNDGTVKNNVGYVFENNSTVETNEGFVEKNNEKGTVGTNNGCVTVNSGKVVTNNDEVRLNHGTVETNNNYISKNLGTVNTNNIDGTVLNHNSGETAPRSIDGETPSEETPVVAGVGTNFGIVNNNFVDGKTYYGLSWGDNVNSLNEIESFVVKGDERNLDKIASGVTRDGYKMTGYKAYERMGGKDSQITGDTTKYLMNAPVWLQILWEQIVTAVAPAASNEPEAKTVKKTVPTSLSGDQLKAGAYVRRGNMTFVIIEVTDTDIRVATAGKLTEQDLADMLGCLKKHLSDAQIAKLIGEPELLEQELVNYFFGGRNEHIAFRAARDLFA